MATKELKAKALKLHQIKLDKIQKKNCFSPRSVTYNIEDELVGIDEKKQR